MEVRHHHYRTLLCIPIVCAILLSPVTVYALMYWDKQAAVPPRVVEQALQVSPEELAKLDAQCSSDFVEAIGPVAAEEGPLNEAVTAFCSCNSNTEIVIRLKAEQYYQNRAAEEAGRLQGVNTQEAMASNEFFDKRFGSIAATATMLPEKIVRQYLVLFRILDEEKREYYRHAYATAIHHCEPYLTSWRSRYSPEIDEYLRARSGILGSAPPKLRRPTQSSPRRVVHLQ